MTVLIGTHERATRSALDRAIRSATDIERIDYATDGPEFVAKAQHNRPLVGLIQADLPDVHIGRAAEALPSGEQPGGLIVVSTTSYQHDAGVMLEHGARGVLLATAPQEEIATAVRAVAEGNFFLAPALLKRFRATIGALLRTPAHVEHGEPLTEREADVLRLLSVGYSNQGIADRLFITTATVRSHVLRILRKFNVRNRSQAVAAAYGMRLMTPAEPAVPARHEPMGAGA